MGIRSILRLTLLCAMCACAAGCPASQPTRYYVLSAMPAGSGPVPCPEGPRTRVVVDTARVPKYLDRPQIMTRAGENRLTLSELDEWAGPLGEGISYVVAQDLRQHLCADVMTRDELRETNPDYRVSLSVIRLDGIPGGEALLDVQWSVSGGQGQEPLVTRESIYTGKVARNSYDALASAYSSLLASLSREIAAGIRSLQASAPGSPPG